MKVIIQNRKRKEIDLDYNEITPACKALKCPKELRSVCKSEISSGQSIICNDLYEYVRTMRGFKNAKSS